MSPANGDLFYNTTTNTLMVYDAGVWVPSSVVNNASLTLQVGVAGATNTTVTVGTGTGFTANTASNATYSVSVGPALTEVATELAAGKSATGLLQVTGVDTLVQVADGTNGQVLSTNGAGVVSWVTPVAAAAVTYSNAAPVGVAVVGSEHYVTSDGTRTGTVSARYIYDTVGWTLIPDNGAQYIDELLDVDTTGKVDGTSLLMWDATKVTGGITGQWVVTSIIDASPTGGSTNDF
jgi:hypothetical protein